MKFFQQVLWAVSSGLALNSFGADIDPAKLPTPAPVVDFAKDIKPLLEASCVSCHGAEKQKGKFRIDSRDAILKGGEEGKAVVENDSAKSPLIHYVARLVEDLEMPPKKADALKPEQIGLLRKWIDTGMQWPAGATLSPAPATHSAPVVSAEKIATLPPPAARQIDFVKDVQPIFAESCYGCHGPKKQELGLRLDHKATALRKGEHGQLIAPGKSAESVLVHMVAGIHEEKMPKKGEPLTPEKIGVLRAWIDQGAQWPDSASVTLKNAKEHWAFRTPEKGTPPLLKNAGWARNTLDAFILSRLETEGLKPSPEADRATLLRRLHLDITGLPPTVKELDAFLADNTPSAYEKVVETLLASPHYGERWGRHWLDAARYADSDGYEKDKPRVAYFYRDWVIGALNRDLPYDQFIIEQLAGDQLPNPTQDQIVATGFLRNSMINEEGGVDPEQFRMEAMFDRMDAIGRSVLGLTIACSQCHNHKYDPFSQEEYYKMFAFLNNDHEAQPLVYSASELMKRSDILRQAGELEAKLKHDTPDWEARLKKWEDEWRAKPMVEWKVIQPVVEDISTGGERYLPQKDGSFLCSGFQPTKHEAKLTIKTDVQNITAFRLELMSDPNLPANGPGRSHLGTFGLTEFKVEAISVKDPKKKENVKFAKATSDLEPPVDTPIHPNFNDKVPVKRLIGPASYAIDGKEETAWSNDIGPVRRNRACDAIFTTEKPISNEGGTELIIRLAQRHGGWNADDLHGNAIGRFRIHIATAANADVGLVPPHVRDILNTPREKRSAAQAAQLFTYWRSTVADWKEVNAKIEALWKEHPEPVTQMTLESRDEMRDTFLLKRGDWLKPGKKINAGVLAVLNPLPADAPQTRLTFAKWMVDPKAPTTPRALVNRVWQTYFGTGLVSTSEDLGTQCEVPSHPELLDWLARDFVDNGWSMKKLHRSIVLSSTYRQQSKNTPALQEKDPYNRLLARAPRLRTEGEVVRDIQLTISGLINLKMGGKAVFPPAPAFLFLPPASYAPFPWNEEMGEDRYRRALYTYRRRSTPYPFLQTFDTPEGNTSCVRRGRSNTPLQALMLLNETVSMESAQAFAKKILEEGGSTDAERITYAFRRAVSRVPSEAEIKTIEGVMAKQRGRIADGWINSHELAVGPGKKPENLPKGTNPAMLAAYTVAARVILNLDETYTKE